MIKEFYDQFRKDIISTSMPALLKADPTDDFAVTLPDGHVQFIGGRAKPRKHQALDLATVAAFAQRFAADDASEGLQTPAIWYSRVAVICLIDDGVRKDEVKLPLTLSKEILALMQIENTQKHMNQREIRFLLRTTFKGALDRHPTFLEAISTVQWEKGELVDSQVGKGKSSLGKQIRETASGIKNLDDYDYITLGVPVFHNAFGRLRKEVVCVFEVCEKEQDFQMFPLPGEVEKAICEGEDDIFSEIKGLMGETTVPIYYGTP